MRKVLWGSALLAAGFFPTAALGQGRGLTAACATLDGNLETSCYVAAQAVHSAQPQLGILVSGGNPTLGAVTTGGLRLGVLPRVSATVKSNLVFARIPDLRDVRVGPGDAISYGDLSIVAPSLSGTATIGLFSGASLAPTIGGIGSIDLLGSASWLPLRLVGSGEFRSTSAELAYGGGLRLGLLRESFTVPGVSVSVLYHRLGEVEWGDFCATLIATSTTSGPGYTLEEGECEPDVFAEGAQDDLGEFSFDLSSWSTRADISKHLLGFGVSAGVGYDRFSSDLEAGVRALRTGEVIPSNAYARVSEVDLSRGRWSAHVNGSYSILVASFAAELGWMQGGDAVAGYPDSMSDFEPADGTFFGSLGVRIGL